MTRCRAWLKENIQYTTKIHFHRFMRYGKRVLSFFKSIEKNTIKSSELPFYIILQNISLVHKTFLLQMVYFLFIMLIIYQNIDKINISDSHIWKLKTTIYRSDIYETGNLLIRFKLNHSKNTLMVSLKFCLIRWKTFFAQKFHNYGWWQMLELGQ